MENEIRASHFTNLIDQSAESIRTRDERYDIPYQWRDTERIINVKIEQDYLGTEWEIKATVYNNIDHWKMLDTVARSMVHLWADKYGKICNWSNRLIRVMMTILEAIDDKQRKLIRRNTYYPHRSRFNIMFLNYYHLNSN